jgi:hypothetical protein
MLRSGMGWPRAAVILGRISWCVLASVGCGRGGLEYQRELDAEASELIPIREQAFHWKSRAPSDCSTVGKPVTKHRRGLTAARGGPQPGHIRQAARVVSSMRPGFRECYQQFLALWPNAQARVWLTFSVDCHGRIVAIDAKVQGLSFASTACLFRVASEKQFEPPEGGASKVHVPVTFVRPTPGKRHSK